MDVFRMDTKSLRSGIKQMDERMEVKINGINK